MSHALPAWPNLDWVRKTATQQLPALRKTDPGAKLAGAQLALAPASLASGLVLRSSWSCCLAVFRSQSRFGRAGSACDMEDLPS